MNCNTCILNSQCVFQEPNWLVGGTCECYQSMILSSSDAVTWQPTHELKDTYINWKVTEEKPIPINIDERFHKIERQLEELTQAIDALVRRME